MQAYCVDVPPLVYSAGGAFCCGREGKREWDKPLRDFMPEEGGEDGA